MALGVVSILRDLCHLIDVRVDRSHSHIHQVTRSRGRHGKEGEKGKEGCGDEEGCQEDERQEEEITGASFLCAACGRIGISSAMANGADQIGASAWLIRRQIPRLAPCAAGWLAKTAGHGPSSHDVRDFGPPVRSTCVGRRTARRRHLHGRQAVHAGNVLAPIDPPKQYRPPLSADDP